MATSADSPLPSTIPPPSAPRPIPLSRRALFSAWIGLPLVPAALSLRGQDATEAKPLRGIFPIAQTPFTDAGQLDLDTLAAEVRFVARAGGHGFVWPQLASEYATLSEPERMDGATAICRAARDVRLPVVLGVQAPQVEQALRYTAHAAKLGADAIIALPPPEEKDLDRIATYYQKIGEACGLPLFVQAIGNMSVEFVVRLSEQVPTLRFVKDEVGSPLRRIRPLREASRRKLEIFTGNHGVTLLDEMRLGSAGSMPAASFVDLYTAVWDLWQAGRKDEAKERFAKTLLLVTQIQVYGIASLKYILQLRGIFPNHVVRGAAAKSPLDDDAKESIKEMVDYVKPYFRT